MRRKGHSIRDIAATLHRGIGTISDELNRNKVAGVYDPSKAHHKAYVRRRDSKFQAMKIVDNPPLRTFVEAKLLEGRSPASIAGRVTKHEKQLPAISADSIERFLASVHGRQMEVIRKQRKARRRRHRRRTQPISLVERIFIDERPSVINNRVRVGDVEADFIVSGKTGSGYLLTVADRKLRVSFIEQILPVSIANVHTAFRRIHARFPELCSITTDNDLLFRQHKELAVLLGVPIYFCHPYHSWEKGTIENTNGIVRQDIPKGSDISCYSPTFVTAVETKLNDRYMACLEYATPQEALKDYRKQQTRLAARHAKSA